MTARVSQLGPVGIAVVSAIEGSSALGAILAGNKVYDGQAPQGSPFPYITLGTSLESANNVFAGYGTDLSQTIDIWTRKTTTTSGTIQELGGRQMKAIYGALYSLLHEQPLTVSGFRVCIGTLQWWALIDDPDGITMHGIARYDIISRQTT